MNTIIFLCLGGQEYVDQTLYAIYSGLGFMPTPPADFQFVIYTDVPEKFDGVPARVVTLPPGQRKLWEPDYDFIMLCKIRVMMLAFEQFGGNVVYLDVDTYFLRSPLELFNRIGPGRAVMHVQEQSLADWHQDKLARLVQSRSFTSPAGEPWIISPHAVMWNAGVIGLNEADAPLLAEVLALTDLFYPPTESPIAEQFAMTIVLNRATRLTETYDIIYHYWFKPTRNEFNKILPGALRETAGLATAKRAARLRAIAPVDPLPRRVRARVKHGLRRLGFFPRGMRQLPPE